MIKIRRKGNGWRMTFSALGTWFAVEPRTMREMHKCLAHYYATEEGHHGPGRGKRSCLLCKKMTERTR